MIEWDPVIWRVNWEILESFHREEEEDKFLLDYVNIERILLEIIVNNYSLVVENY